MCVAEEKKQAIVISCVRSNERREVGFLENERRMNVAVTRARKLCVLICDSETLEGNKFLKGMEMHFREFGDVRSAEMY